MEWNLSLGVLLLLMWTFSRPYAYSVSSISLSPDFTTSRIFRFRLRILWCDIPKSRRRIFCFACSVLFTYLMLMWVALAQFQTLRLLLSCSRRCTRSYWMLILFSILIALCGFTPMAMINLNYVSIFSVESLSYFKNSLSPFIRNELVFVYIGCLWNLSICRWQIPNQWWFSFVWPFVGKENTTKKRAEKRAEVETSLGIVRI